MHNDNNSGLEAERRERTQFSAQLIDALVLVWDWRKFIIGITAGVAILSVAISLLLPNWYRASSRLLPPERTGSSAIASAMLDNLPSAAAGLLGGSSGNYSRYLTILTSRQLLDSVVDNFDLISVYETESARSPRDAAIENLLKNTDFEIDNKFDYLSVSVLDKSPQRAADMSNFMVARLNEINSELTSLNAASFRRYVERRYHTAVADLDSVLDAVEVFQREHGLVDLPAQSVGFFEQIGVLRAEAVRAEVEFEALRDQFGETNPRVTAARSVVDAANRTYQRALSGAEATLPVPLAEMPTVIRRYADLERERILQTRIIEVVAPMYEQARFDEEREVQAVQVIDYATPPVLKAKPRRSLLVIAATMSAFFLAVAFVLARGWWNNNFDRLVDITRTAHRRPSEKRIAAGQET